MTLDELKRRYDISDDVLLHDVSKLVDYKDLTFREIDLILSMKPEKSETVRIEVVDMAKQFMSIKQIRDTFFPEHKGVDKARAIMKAFEYETMRIDSKVDKSAFIRNGQDKWVFTLALLWFMKNQTQLEDETRRNSVEKFNAEKFKSLLFFAV